VGIYRGPDPILKLVNLIKDVEKSWKFKLLYSSKSLDVRVNNLIETVAFHLQLDSEYERHYRISHAYPRSRKGAVSLFPSSDALASCKPSRPTSFIDKTDEFPREATARVVRCTKCPDGFLLCPNCEGEKVVTCPKCYTFRGGDCSRCRGTGKVTCPSCGGTGECPECGGTGLVTCPRCGGTGRVVVVRTRYEKCPSCKGEDAFCTTCWGTGVVEVEEEVVVEDPYCGGTGRVQCSKCGGTGSCRRCGGTGEIDCPECGGTGICQFCQGRGVKTCPTCSGRGRVVCPICQGEAELFLYTSDIYEYRHIIDSELLFPRELEGARKHFDTVSCGFIEIDELSEDDVEEKVGLLNKYILEMLETSRRTFDSLLRKTRGREFVAGIVEDDFSSQDRLLVNMVSNLESDWKSRKKDDYYARFRLHIPDSWRERRHKDIHNKMLFQKRTFKAYPVSSISLDIGGKKKQMYVFGTAQRCRVEAPSPPISWAKASLILLTLITGLYGVLLAFGIVAMDFPIRLPIIPFPCILALSSFLLYTAIVKKTSPAESKLITILGDSDDLNLLLFSLLAHCISYRKVGVVLDEFALSTSEHLLRGLRIGSSLTYSVQVGEKARVRLVCLSTSSLLMASETKELISNSDALILVLSEKKPDKDCIERIKALLPFFRGSAIAVIGRASSIKISRKHETFAIDLDGLRDAYLKRSPDVVCQEILKVFAYTAQVPIRKMTAAPARSS